MQFSKTLAIGVVIAVIGWLIYKSVVALPSSQLRDTDSLQSSLIIQSTKLDNNKKLYQDIKASDKWNFLSKYSELEKWEDKFNEAKVELDNAQKIFRETINPIIDRNHKDDLKQLISAKQKARAFLDASKNLGDQPLTRINLILDAKTNESSYLSEAKFLQRAAHSTIEKFSQVAKESKAKHTNKEEDIDKKESELQGLSNSIDLQLSKMQDQISSNSINYAEFADSYSILQSEKKVLDSKARAYSDLFSQLDQSYVRVLRDQKIEYTITIGRATWCNGDYCYEGDEVIYPEVSVDADTFEFFDNLDLQTIATRKKSWGSFDLNLNIPKARWDALKISSTYRWNPHHSEGQYWVHKLKAQPYHRYTAIRNNELSEGVWEPVSFDLYEKHYDNLGLAIYSKAIGQYNFEASQDPEPVGMSAIAEPTMVDGVPTGSNQYGEWRQSGTGGSFFYYYGMYRLFDDLMGSRRYSYNDWNAYNNRTRGQPYYGSKKQYGTFGSSTYINARYADSSFFKRNPSALTAARTGNRSKVRSSLRGSGDSTRGRGPGRSGK